MKKRMLTLFLVLAMVFTLAFTGCTPEEPAEPEAPEEPSEPETPEEPEEPETPEEPAEKFVIGMITDTGGLGDQSFNDSAYEGLLRAEEEFGVEVKILESESEDDYGPNLSAFAEEDLDLIISVGFLMQSATDTAGKQFPDKNFAIIDERVDLPNVAGLTFKEHEGSFLVGVIAGLTTESDVIGFVGGMQFPLIEKFQYGFEAGVKSVNPDAEVLVNYTGSFGDVGLGKEAALAQEQLGADVVYHAAGGCGIGVIQAAGEQGFWAIGVDQDQSALDPEHVLCSMIKRVDNATYMASKAIVEGTFDGSDFEFGLAVEGVGYSDNAGNLSEEIKTTADMYKTAIINGEIMVPYDLETFEAFEVPEM
ncbi:nucleoside-binding protein [Dethiosulfatibacter aminovorans DSM 17477]|uniref:Nucleoside-binding protein n=1 Tax=Dethiosulfatibacter aminovorans DSM 17477 TaxID=1121476 RepID=A0A1M6FCF6_9FIRM|nr:BMP family ABC transporter substrate-binding protein [Dethiosulfatibacter aminovorans]SHI95418.1 nucleoside-binding protein [Dethiosulfatibacter aminovorans DSM 17477]